MPEYLSPGVYVEERSFRSKSIEGVGTSTTAFVGPTRYGPTKGEPELMTSFSQFERIYGGLDSLDYGTPVTNYLAHAVRAFFDNGGSRLYIARTYDAPAAGAEPGDPGHSYAPIPDDASSGNWIARYPGVAGDMTITVTGRLGADAFSSAGLSQVREGDLVVVRSGGTATVRTASFATGEWVFTDDAGATTAISTLDHTTADIHPMTLTVEIQPPGKFAQPLLWTGLTASPLIQRNADSVTQVFGADISNTMQAMETPVVLEPANGVELAALVNDLTNVADWEALIAANTFTATNSFVLANGSDGSDPIANTYIGIGDDSTPTKSGLKSFEDLEEISIVAAPGYSRNGEDVRNAITDALITHCELMRYRVAVLDSPDNVALSGVRNYRARFDTTRAALYYPWVRVLDPISNTPINLPPSGFVAGIYARNDVENGVHKAPANEVVRGAIGMETLINKAQQDVLNPLGINCLRYFEGRGIRVWGARTISSDPEWKYLNIRRYFAFLEASIERATQWAVFEPNGEALWANVRRTISDFLYNEWKEEHLAGTKPDQAFFVRCDRSTMTQNDLDNGRMICLIGVAPLYPAEFVIFRIGQWTADA